MLQTADPVASPALRVIAYFDSVVESGNGLEDVVRGAASLSGVRAGLEDSFRGTRILIDPDWGRIPFEVPAKEWQRIEVTESVSLWLAVPASDDPLFLRILERGALAARAIIERTGGKASVGRPNPALIEIILNPSASDRDRESAAKTLGLAMDFLCNVFASSDGHFEIIRHGVSADTALADRDHARGGVGPAVRPVDLAGTVEIARMASCFAADGTSADPGPRIVYAEKLGTLILLAQATARFTMPDVDGLEVAAASAPWMLPTLEALVTHQSLRATAHALMVHHSTLQQRITHAERRLGWPIRDMEGHYRLWSAMMVRRMGRNAARWGIYEPLHSGW